MRKGWTKQCYTDSLSSDQFAGWMMRGTALAKSRVCCALWVYVKLYHARWEWWHGRMHMCIHKHVQRVPSRSYFSSMNTLTRPPRSDPVSWASCTLSSLSVRSSGTTLLRLWTSCLVTSISKWRPICVSCAQLLNTALLSAQQLERHTHQHEN